MRTFDLGKFKESCQSSSPATDRNLYLLLAIPEVMFLGDSWRSPASGKTSTPSPADNSPNISSH
jgi:hypothetical protein